MKILPKLKAMPPRLTERKCNGIETKERAHAQII